MLKVRILSLLPNRTSDAGNGIQTGLKIQGQVSNWIKSSTLFRRTNSTNAAVAKWFIRAKLKISSVKSGEGSTPSCGTIKKLLNRSDIHTAIHVMLMMRMVIAGWMMNIDNL